MLLGFFFLVNAEDKAKLMEHNQQQHQVQPPKMNDKEGNPPEVRELTLSD